MNRTIKPIYAILGGVILLSSCQHEEIADLPLSENDRRIVFNTSLPEVASRAQITTSDIEYFCLTAFDETDNTYLVNDTLTEYFKNERIEKRAGSDKFASDNCTWPLPGHEYDVLHFFAHYPELPAEWLKNISTVDGSTTIGYQVNGFTIEKNTAKQIDFVTAYTTGTMAKNQFSGIALEFKHQLSRIEVMAKGNSRSFKLEIAGVRFGEVATKGDFIFTTDNNTGKWADTREKDVVEYIYQPGDKIVLINDSEAEVSIMGGSNGINYAMLIPSKYDSWDYSNDNNNAKEGMYIGVLLRVLDKTPGGNDKQQYPYYDNSQGLNAMKIDRVFLAVDNNGNVTANPGKLFKNDNGQYFTDEAMTIAYTAPAGSSVKEFGWATLPISADWKPGYTYTYTLDYTYGMGLHGPEVTGDVAPKAADPVISDRVGIALKFKDWQTEPTVGVEVPGN